MNLSRISVLLLALVLVFTTGCFSIFGAKEYTISGTVVDAEGNPIEDVKINITGKTEAIVDEFDEEGAWTAAVKGKVTVTPVHELYSFAPAEIEVKAARDDLDFVGTYLGPYNIAGTVLGEFGNTISGAKVVITGQVEKEVDVNSEDGTWTAEVRGEVNVTAEAEGYDFNLITIDKASDQVIFVGIVSNLLIHYSFDENEGTTAADSSTNELNAALYGGASFAQGLVGNAVSLDGVDGYVELPDDFFVNEDNLSVCLWINQKEQRDWSRVFDFAGPFGFVYMSPLENNLHLTLFGNENSPMGVVTFFNLDVDPIPNNTWTHIVATFSDTEMTIYINGDKAGSLDIGMKVKDVGGTFDNYIGRSIFEQDPYSFADIDDFRVYSKVLTPEQINAMYSQYNPED